MRGDEVSTPRTNSRLPVRADPNTEPGEILTALSRYDMTALSRYDIERICLFFKLYNSAMFRKFKAACGD